MTTPVESTQQPKRQELPYGRGTAVGYTESYSEPTTADLEDVVAQQNARGPE